jgi:hypothetical protein
MLLERQSGMLGEMYERADKPAEEKKVVYTPEWLRWVNEKVVQPAEEALGGMTPLTVLENLKAAERDAEAALEAAKVTSQGLRAHLARDVSDELPQPARALRFDRNRRIRRFVSLFGSAAVLLLGCDLVGLVRAEELTHGTNLPLETAGHPIPASLFDLLSLMFSYLFSFFIVKPTSVVSLLFAPIPTTHIFNTITGLYTFLQFVATLVLDYVYKYTIDYIVRFQIHGLTFILAIILLRAICRSPVLGKLILMPLLRRLENHLDAPGMLTIQAPLVLKWAFYATINRLIEWISTVYTHVPIYITSGVIPALEFLWILVGPPALLYYASYNYNHPVAHRLSLKVRKTMRSKRLWTCVSICVVVIPWISLWWYKERPVIVGPATGQRVVTWTILH